MKVWQNYPPNSFEYVYLHGLSQKKRGRNPSVSMSSLGVSNPRDAFKLSSYYAYLPINGVSYEPNIKKYLCSKCKVGSVKLWRMSHSFNINLHCADCAGKEEHVDVAKMSNEGKIVSEFGGMTNQIGCYVPAVPTEMDSYWGYTSIPYVAWVWWEKLPNRKN